MPEVISGDSRWTIDGKTVYHATECTVSLTRETKERNTKDTEGIEKAKGAKSFTMTVNSLATYDAETGASTHNFRSLIDAFNDDEDVKVPISFTPEGADYTLEGEAIITSLEGGFTVREDGTTNFTMEGGKLTPTDITP